MTMTVGARSLDNEERSNFRDYMSLLSLSVDASMTVREVMAVAYLIGRHDASLRAERFVAGSDGEPSSDPWRSVGLRVQPRLRGRCGHGVRRDRRVDARRGGPQRR